jgi:hypothetical protein
VFNTYEVDNTEEVRRAIKHNGNIRVEFYRTLATYHPTITYTNTWWTPYGDQYDSGTAVRKLSHVSDNTVMSYSTSNIVVGNALPRDSATMETGRIEAGSVSNQKFTEVNMNFETYPFKTVKYKIYPASAESQHVTDIRHYCVECGRRKRKTEKYCPQCGTKF